MQTISITDFGQYRVHIGAGILPRLGDYTAQVVDGRVAVLVSDSTVAPLYAKKAEESLINAHFSVHRFIFPAGEASKDAKTYLQLLNFLAEHEITRADCLIALGGGVVGDLTGFAAATYLRGVAYLQVPTTVLAMIDASVGGKTAIDLPSGKNLVGAFYAPRAVVCDTDCLSTLPPAVFADGCAEIVKYGMIFDEALLSALESEGLSFPREAVIGRCVTLKAQAVALDPHDRGNRRLLNFGHTVGHAIERASGYAVSHGQAVAIGMCIVTKAAGAHGICAASLYERLHTVLEKLNLPTNTDIALSVLAAYMHSDKKRDDAQISLVIPATAGCAQIKAVPISQLETFIKAGM